MKKFGAILLSVALLLMVAACDPDGQTDLEKYGANYRVENTTADQRYLYGMCDLGGQEYGVDHQKTAQLIKNLGAKSVRFWLHCNWVMSDPSTMKPEAVAKFKTMLSHLDGQQIIGMNHSNFHAGGYTNSVQMVAKPTRDLNEGSYYLEWLEDYETTWYNLVTAFPEITYWEIDNESNSDVFMCRLESASAFSLKEKAAIYYDMLYYASQGIHKANPNAVTVMGGLIMSSAESFLEEIYSLIFADGSHSKYPDDYFQVACWHPYTENYTENKFVELNNDVYDVIKTNEGKDKKVFLSEFGWSNNDVSEENAATRIASAYKAIKQSLPYVESAHYFRMYDVLDNNWGSESEKQFGLFTDPISTGPTGLNLTLAKPKASATAYQTAAGGSGSLTIYQRSA